VETRADNRYEIIHRALLSGLLSNIATKDIDDVFTATRGRTIHLFPGSPQAKTKPKWLISAELIETSRLFAHTIAQIKPEWVIDSAKHLCKYNYNSPRYDSRTGSIKAQRKTLLYGLVLRDKERVNYGSINPTEARTIFIQQALVDANYKPSKKDSFFDHNQTLIRDIEKIETKTRKRNLLINEQALFAFYDERIPAQINNRNSLERWLTKASSDKNSTNNDLLILNREQLLVNQIEPEDVAQFPDKIDVHGKSVSIIYKFNPGQAQDGVTMVVPISVLAPFPEYIGDWLVPGLLREKCIALIKTLPKQIRRNFAPAADAVDRIFDSLKLSNSPLHKELATLLFKTRGIKVEHEQFDLSKLDQYYLMNYRVIDVDGSLVDEDHDLTSLKQRYADSVQESVHADHSPERSKFEQLNITEWDFGELAEHIEYLHQGMTVRVYPSLIVESDNSISLKVSDQQGIAEYQSSIGILQLAQNKLSSGTQRQAAKYLLKELMSAKKKKQNNPNSNGLSSLATQLKHVGVKPSNRNKWVSEIMLAGLNQSCFVDHEININDIRNNEAFEKVLSNGSKNWVSHCIEIEQSLSNALDHRDRVLSELNAVQADTIEIDSAVEDMKSQLYRLFEPRILRYTSLKQLNQYIRYLRAIESRIEKLKFASKTVNEEIALQEIQTQFEQKLDNLGDSKISLSPDYVYHRYPDLYHFSVSLEEWRVSIFAQHLKTMQPVSEKRLRNAWQKIEDEGLALYKSKPLIEHVIDNITGQVNGLILCVNRNHQQYKKYGYPLVSDKFENTNELKETKKTTRERYQGPLAGITATIPFLQSALKNNEQSCVLISPCDSPMLPDNYVAKLSNAMVNNNASSAVVHDGKRPQNLHCLIHSSAWASLIAFYQDGGRAMHLWHKRNASIEVDFSDQANCFLNINSAEMLS